MCTDALDLWKVEGCGGSPGGGRYVVIRLAIQNGAVLDAGYRCNGCAYAHQLARGLTDFLKGRTLEQAQKLDAQDLLALAGPVPEGKDIYAGMAIDALKDALKTPPPQPHRTAGEVCERSELGGVTKHPSDPSIHDLRLTIHGERK
jgi:NifU-like protein involved in Fe-S cluster formation